MRKIALIFFLCLILSSFVSATEQFQLRCSGDFTDELGNHDGTSSDVTFTNMYPTFNVSGNGTAQSCYFDGIDDDIIMTTYNGPTGTGARTFCSWVNLTNTGGSQTQMAYGQSTTGNQWVQSIEQDGLAYGIRLAGGFMIFDTNSDVVDNTFHHLCCQLNGTTINDINCYQDGVKLTSVDTSQSVTISTSTGTVKMGEGLGGGEDMNGRQDEMRFWNQVLTEEEIKNVYNCRNITGDGCTGSAPPVENITDSVESTAVVKQVGTVTLIGPASQTILASDYNLTVESDLYGGYSFNVLSNLANTLFCELYIDGQVVSNVTRSNLGGVTGSVYIQSGIFNQTAGNHTQMLECARQGAGSITVSNAIGIGHILVDEANRTIPHEELLGTTNVVSGSAWTKMGELNHTIGNITDGSRYHSLILEGAITYSNNGAGVEVLGTYIEINDTYNCSFVPRTVSGGTTGSVTSDCMLENISVNETIKIELFGNGTDATYDYNIISKSFFLDDEELAGGAGALVGLTWTGSNPTKLFNLTGGNLNHDLANVFQKVGYSILTNETAEVNTWITLNNSAGTFFRQTVNFTREFTAGSIGNLIGHDSFLNVPEDNYTLEVYATCGDNALCEMVGGSSLGYITDVTTTLVQAFNVTAFDNYDNSVLLNFSVTDGATFSTTTGSLLYFSNNFFENLTVSSPNYFSAYYLNHDTTTSLVANLNQTLINFTCSEKITGNVLACADSLSSRSFNPNVAGNPHKFIGNVSGYYSKDLFYNVTALEKSTKDISGFYSTNLTLDATSPFGTVTNCNYTVDGVTYPSYSESVAGAPSTTLGLINGSYTVFADCSGNNTYAITNATILIENVTQSQTFSLQSTNSFNFVFRDSVSLALLDYVNVSLDLISDTFSNIYSTTTGSLYIDLLTPEFYTIRFNSEDYSERFYYFSLLDRTFNNITLYLLNNSVSDNITITITDEDNKRLSEAYLKVLRYDITTNTYLLQEIFKTDVEGKAYIEAELGTEFYRFFVDFPFGTTVYLGSPDYIEDTTFTIPVLLDTLYANDFFSSLGVAGNITFNEASNNWRWDYTDSLNTISGACLYVYETSLTQNTLLNSSCTDTSSGSILVPLTPVNETNYVAVGVVLIGGTEYYWGEKQLNVGGYGDEQNKKYRLFLVLIVTLIFMLLFSWDVTIMFFVMPLPLLVTSMVKFVDFDRTVAIGFQIVGVIIAYWINKRR